MTINVPSRFECLFWPRVQLLDTFLTLKQEESRITISSVYLPSCFWAAFIADPSRALEDHAAAVRAVMQIDLEFDVNFKMSATLWSPHSSHCSTSHPCKLHRSPNLYPAVLRAAPCESAFYSSWEKCTQQKARLYLHSWSMVTTIYPALLLLMSQVVRFLAG